MQLAVLDHLPSSIERCFSKRIWSVRVFDARRGSSNALCGELNRLLRGLRSVLCIGTLAMVFLLSGVASAAANPPSVSYFVSTSGSDSNNGSSPAAPWQTLAKLNATRLAPGSAVYLQCGSVFRETLEIGSPGAPSAPISYDSYGACTGTNPPRISGADRLTTWSAQQQSGFTVYAARESSTPALVFEDDHRLAAASAIAAMKTGSFYYDSGRKLVYVRTRDDSAPGSHSLEASVRENAVVVKGV